MNADVLIATTQLARNAAGVHMGEFSARCRAQWQSWLMAGVAGVDSAQETVVEVCVVTALTTFEDIEFSAGLAQLLGVHWLDPTLIFTLPTSAATAFFQKKARQRSFHQLVRAVSEVELVAALENMDDDAILCVVPPLSILTTHYLKALRDVVARRHDFRCDRSRAGVFRLGTWRGMQGRLTGDENQNLAFSVLPLCLGEASPRLERSFIEILDCFWDSAHREAPSEPACLSVEGLPCLSNGSQLVLPAGSRHGDLRLRAAPSEPGGWYARRALKAADLGEPLRVEPPLALIRERPAQAEIVLKAAGSLRCLALSLHLPASRLESWMATCYLNRGGAGNAVIRAFAQGIGCELRYAEDETGPRPGVPIVWGVLRGSDRVIAYAKQSGQYFLYIDHAYFNRGHGLNYRISRNAYEAGQVRDCPPDRLAAHQIVLQPWKRGGANILVCPPTDYFMATHGCADWLETTLEMLGHHTDRRLVVRRKPQLGETVEPLAEALDKAHALVTHSSNVAIEAVVAGVPIFVSPSSGAAPMGLTDLDLIETPVYPDREKWLAHLAYCQFSFEEIRTGVAWRMLLEWEDRALV